MAPLSLPQLPSFSQNLKSPASLLLTVCLLSVVLFLTWSFCLQARLSLQPVSSLSYAKFLCACPTAGSLEVWWPGGSCWLDSRVLRAVLFGRWMGRELGKSRGSKRAWRKWPLVSQSPRNELNFQTQKPYQETEHRRFRIKRKSVSQVYF